jgi:hypothetical protein
MLVSVTTRARYSSDVVMCGGLRHIVIERGSAAPRRGGHPLVEEAGQAELSRCRSTSRAISTRPRTLSLVKMCEMWV